MTDETPFTEDAWGSENDDESEKSDFAERVEEIREQREQDDNTDDEESIDKVVKRLSGRAYRVKYPDPADPESTESERIVADNIQPTAAGMVFARENPEKGHVYPAPVEFEELSDGEIRSWVKTMRHLKNIFRPLMNRFSG